MEDSIDQSQGNSSLGVGPSLLRPEHLSGAWGVEESEGSKQTSVPPWSSLGKGPIILTSWCGSRSSLPVKFKNKSKTWEILYWTLFPSQLMPDLQWLYSELPLSISWGISSLPRAQISTDPSDSQLTFRTGLQVSLSWEASLPETLQEFSFYPSMPSPCHSFNKEYVPQQILLNREPQVFPEHNYTPLNPKSLCQHPTQPFNWNRCFTNI